MFISIIITLLGHQSNFFSTQTAVVMTQHDAQRKSTYILLTVCLCKAAGLTVKRYQALSLCSVFLHKIFWKKFLL
jgi:hypothetical protein